MSKSTIELDKKSFYNRLAFLYSIWLSETVNNPEFDILRDVDLIKIECGKGNDRNTAVTNKNVTMHYWLFGFEFSDTLIILSRSRKAIIVTSNKKVGILNQLVDESDKTINLILITKDSDISDSLIKLKQASLSSLDKKSNQVKMGKFEDIDKADGTFIADVKDFFSKDEDLVQIQTFILNKPLTYLLSIKDQVEKNFSKKSSILAVQMIKGVLLNRVETILDKELKETHKSISLRAEKALNDDTFTKSLESKYNIDTNDIDLVYSLIQSGNNFELKPVMNNEDFLCLNTGCIIISLGTKYREYCTNITRTYFLNATEKQKEMYNYLLDIFEYILKNFRDGVKFKDLYTNIHDKIIKDKGKDIAYKFIRNIGHTIGLEFRDPYMLISNDTNENVKAMKGMLVSISVGFNNLINENGNNYAIWISDTLYLNQDDTIENLTQGCSKKMDNVSYELEDEPVKEENVSKKKKNNKKTDQDIKKEKKSPIKKEHVKKEEILEDEEDEDEEDDENIILEERLRTRSRQQQNANTDEIKKLEEKQKDLRKKKTRELKKRFGENMERSKSDINMLNSIHEDEINIFDTKISSYKKIQDYPKDLTQNRLYVDTNNESVLIPINGIIVPFHISRVKNLVITQEEGDTKFQVLRLNFVLPSIQNLENIPSNMKMPIFIKELMIKSDDSKALNTVFRGIKDMIKKFKSKGSVEDERMELEASKILKPLEINRQKQRVMMRDIGIRPTLGTSRRQFGALEAHMNGLRFTCNKGETIDILYANIKHAIFQPVENDLLVILHLNLRYSMNFGKKKTTDIQFYMEIGNQTDDLEQRRGRNIYDPDEILEEQKEREHKKRLNSEFKLFIQGIENLCNNMFEFEIPYRDLGFYGVPGRSGVSNVQLYPTASCLIHLVEWPPFILSLDDVEIVSFERVEQGLRNFDMIFVFRDYNKPIKRVDSIPIEYFDIIRRWLNEMDIVYYEGRQNLNWSAVLKTILSDIQDFIQNDGFNGFLGDSDSEQSNGSDDSDEDEVYTESEEDEEDEEDEDEELSDLEEESSGDSYQDLPSDEEEGLSWDELEKQAIKEETRKLRDNPQDVKTTTNKR